MRVARFDETHQVRAMEEHRHHFTCLYRRALTKMKEMWERGIRYSACDDCAGAAVVQQRDRGMKDERSATAAIDKHSVRQHEAWK